MSDTVKTLIVLGIAGALVAALVLVLSRCRQPAAGTPPGPAGARAASDAKATVPIDAVLAELEKELDKERGRRSATSAQPRPLTPEEKRVIDEKVRLLFQRWLDQQDGAPGTVRPATSTSSSDQGPDAALSRELDRELGFGTGTRPATAAHPRSLSAEERRIAEDYLRKIFDEWAKSSK